MGICEICGKETEELFRAEIEGIQMDACSKCARFGKILYTPKPKKTETEAKKNSGTDEPELRIVDDYAKIVRQIREKLGLTQEEFAKKINEKESLMSKIESGKTIPTFALAEKLEKMFHVVLIEAVEEEKPEVRTTSQKEATLGDFITIKKRKK